MTDTVTSNVVRNTVRDDGMYEIHLTGISDGTGETNVIKIDKSGLLKKDGTEPSHIVIKSIRWSSQGYSYIKLTTDRTTDNTMMLLMGNGYDEWDMGLQDPSVSSDTGDLFLSTVGATNGATYDITIKAILK